MSRDQWKAIDLYFSELLLPADPVLEAALKAADEAQMPTISVAPNQGKLLGLLAGAMGARRILEIGTLGGYSTIWLGRALPADGMLITLEVDPKHAEVARANLARAGLAEKVTVRLGAALDTLPQVEAEGHGPFDFVFIDADKVNTAAYFEWALKLTRRGSLIIVDNVVRNGKVIEADTDDVNVQGIRQFMTELAAESRVSATVVQTVGSKGHDGLAVALVL